MSAQKIGRYLVERELGRGGMAVVYLAHDPAVKRRVALKVLPRQFMFDPQFRLRFQREAETIAALEHPHIVPIYDFGEHEDQPYIVMRLLSGGSLLDRLQAGPLSLSGAAEILGQIGGALDYAHARGVVHRDLKPSNILFDERGAAFLSDFGIAKILEATAGLTGTGLVGTPAYMSPEQARGDAQIDGRSDIYALGCIAFEMLTGKPPYQADTPLGLAVKHMTEPVPHIRELKADLPPGCQTVIARSMAKDRADRYPTAHSLAAAVAALQTASAAPPVETVAGAPPATPPTARPRAAAERRPARPRRRPTWLWALAGLVAFVFVVLLIGAVGVLALGALRAGSAEVAATQTPEPAAAPTTADGLEPTMPPKAPPTAAPPTYTAVPSPTVAPTGTLEPFVIEPYCAMFDDSPVFVSAGQPVTLEWRWTATQANLVQEHIETAAYRILLDGRPVTAQRMSAIEYVVESGWYKVSWYADVGVLPAGEHLAERYLSWSRQISDGWNTYGPGGQIETEYHTCQIIVR